MREHVQIGSLKQLLMKFIYTHQEQDFNRLGIKIRGLLYKSFSKFDSIDKNIIDTAINDVLLKLWVTKCKNIGDLKQANYYLYRCIQHRIYHLWNKTQHKKLKMLEYDGLVENFHTVDIETGEFEFTEYDTEELITIDLLYHNCVNFINSQCKNVARDFLIENLSQEAIKQKYKLKTTGAVKTIVYREKTRIIEYFMPVIIANRELLSIEIESLAFN